MAKKTLQDAVYARLVANFSSATILKKNEDVLPPETATPWVRLDFPVSATEPQSLAHTNMETGSFRVVVATEILSGEDDSLTLCEAVAAVYARQKFSGVTCYVPRINDGYDNGDYYMRAVIVPYRYEFAAP